jgi:type IV pilus assembly protein PilC
VLTAFTRQLATLIAAGMPLLRGLRILREQEGNPAMREVIRCLEEAIEAGASFSEALSAHPGVFDRLYVNMVKAGELGGVLEITLTRLAELREKSQRIKGKVTSAMFYPCAVLTVAAGIIVVMMAFVVPRFKVLFEGLMNGQPLPAFTRFLMAVSDGFRNHALLAGMAMAAPVLAFWLVRRTETGRLCVDRLKLALPALGPVFRKAAISRFARTFGTLLGSGVPVLQALVVVKETAGNRTVGKVVAQVHEQVKQGEPIAPTLKASPVFPAIVAGMVDVGEQTGALPDLLLKIADTCDEEVDNSVNAMTSLLEPIMIVLLAVLVGSIVIGMFLPLIRITEGGFENPGQKSQDV